jgi:hypothetical protein
MKRFLLFTIVVLHLSCAEEKLFTADCSTPATVKDLTGLDGCGFVFELTDGTRLEPVRNIGFCGTPPLPKEVTDDPLNSFTFVDGKKVWIDYVPAEGASTCMAGQLVKITCIKEIPAGTDK